MVMYVGMSVLRVMMAIHDIGGDIRKNHRRRVLKVCGPTRPLRPSETELVQDDLEIDQSFLKNVKTAVRFRHEVRWITRERRHSSTPASQMPPAKLEVKSTMIRSPASSPLCWFSVAAPSLKTTSPKSRAIAILF